MAERPAALFDIDGTLIDSNELHVAAWMEAFGGLGFGMDPVAIRAQIGKGGDKLVPTLLPGSDEALQQHVSERHGTIFKGRYLAQARPFPRAHDLLARVRDSGRAVVLASSASQEEAEHYLGLLDARDIVAASTSIDDVGQSKPAPDIFATALAKIGGDARAAITVGDSPYDIEAAAKSGVPTVALLSGWFDRTVLQAAGARAIYADAADLLARFDSSPLAGA